jgi:hypothetical protein
VRRTFWLLWCAVLAVAGGTAIVWLCIGRLSNIEFRIVVTAVGVFLPLATAVAAVRMIGLGAARLLGWLALAAVPFELAAFIDSAWYGETDYPNKDYKWFPTALAWTVASLLVTTAARTRGLARFVFFALTFLFAVAGAAVATVMLWSNVDDDDWGRALASLGVAAGASWLVGAGIERLVRPQIGARDAT